MAPKHPILSAPSWIREVTHQRRAADASCASAGYAGRQDHAPHRHRLRWRLGVPRGGGGLVERNMPSVKTVLRTRPASCSSTSRRCGRTRGATPMRSSSGWAAETAVRRVSPPTAVSWNPSSGPTAPISSARFAEYVAQDAQNHGMALRFSYAPYPLVGRPREVLRGYVEGNDPTTGKPLMPQIVEALTRPLTWKKRNPKASRAPPGPV